MAGNGVEVGVAMQKCDIVPYRDDGDQTVRQATDRCPFPAAGPIQGRGRFMVGRLLERHEPAAIEQAPEVTGLSFVTRAGEDLEDYEPGCSKRLLGLDRGC